MEDPNKYKEIVERMSKQQKKFFFFFTIAGLTSLAFVFITGIPMSELEPVVISFVMLAFFYKVYVYFKWRCPKCNARLLPQTTWKPKFCSECGTKFSNH